MRVLLLERDAETRLWLEGVVRGRGHAVTACDDAERAWEAYQEAPHPMVVVEWAAPAGRFLCRRIRGAPEGWRPVVLASGLSDRPAEIEAALRAGADDHLPIPVDAGTLEVRLAVAEGYARRREERARGDQKLHQLRQAVDTLHVGVSITDARGRIVYLNPAAAEMHGYRVEELAGRPARMLSPREYWREMTGNQLREVRRWRRERPALRKDGTTFPVQLLSDVVTDEEGQPVGLVTVCEDVSDHKRAESALRESEERYALAVRGANDGLWDWNLKTDEIYVSSRWKAMLGLEEDELGPSASEWVCRIHPDDVERVKAKVAAHLAGRTAHFEDEHRMRHKDGTYRWMLSRGFAARDPEGRPTRMAGAQTDITDRKTYDPLTELPNRALFEEQLAQTMARARRRPDALYAVLFLDLDRFKAANDSLGHLAGDELLVAVARRLETCVRPGDLVSRFGGDEFAILLESIRDVSDATRVAQRVQNELEAAFTVQGHEVVTSASIGIALSASGYDRPEAILRDADAAMYRAKAGGKGRFEVFDETMRVRLMARVELETDLRHAVDRGELRLHYQPVYLLGERRLAWFEALLRWQHPRRGLVEPAEFLPLAEDTGLILSLGNWVVHEACRQLRAWRDRSAAPEPASISVNVSGRQLADPGFPRTVRDALKKFRLEPGGLRIEIAERVLAEAASSAAPALGELRALGVALDVDNFGTGHSSLSVLERLRPQTLKIDRGVVAGTADTGGSSAVVRAILAVAEELMMGVTAEGVESEDQALGLQALGCRLGQGYYFSRPLDEDAAGALVPAANGPLGDQRGPVAKAAAAVRGKPRPPALGRAL